MQAITISLAGPGAADFTDELDAAGIPYTKRTYPSRPGFVVRAAAGDILDILKDSATYVALAAVLIQWLRNRGSREITIVTDEYKIVHAKGMSVDELKDLLAKTRRLSVLDTVKPDTSPEPSIDKRKKLKN